MKSTRSNRWLKLIVGLLVIVIIVMLLIPSEPTYRQLAMIEPGITIEQVKQRLSEPTGRLVPISAFSSAGLSTITYYMQGHFWKPSISVSVNSTEGVSFQKNTLTWIGQSHLLWVEHDNGVVTKTWLFPITRTGGGIQGCINTLKQYWSEWLK